MIDGIKQFIVTRNWKWMDSWAEGRIKIWEIIFKIVIAAGKAGIK